MRNKLPIFVVILSPVLLSLSLVFMNAQKSVLYENNKTEVGAVHNTTTVQKCMGYDCITIGYSIIGETNSQV